MFDSHRANRLRNSHVEFGKAPPALRSMQRCQQSFQFASLIFLWIGAATNLIQIAVMRDRQQRSTKIHTHTLCEITRKPTQKLEGVLVHTLVATRLGLLLFMYLPSSQTEP